MEKKDKITLVVFIFLIIAIIFVVGISSYKTRKLVNVDRKIEYIMGYSYDSVLNKGSSLFLQTIELLNNKEVFDYAQNFDESIKYYSINDVNKYVKIINFSLAINTLSSSALEEYMNYKKIIYFENNYFMEDAKMEKNNYIGSIIDIDRYDNNYVYFKNTNYYCNNSEYLGIMYEEPNCEFTKNDSMFVMKLENNMFKIDNIKDFDFLNK